MRRALPVICITFLLIFSCSKDNNNADTRACGVNNPLEDLPWLKNRIAILAGSDPQSAKYQFVSVAEYRGSNVFIFGNCDPFSFTDFPVISCTNVRLGNISELPADSLLNRRTIWRSQDSLCNP